MENLEVRNSAKLSNHSKVYEDLVVVMKDAGEEGESAELVYNGVSIKYDGILIDQDIDVTTLTLYRTIIETDEDIEVAIIRLDTECNYEVITHYSFESVYEFSYIAEIKEIKQGGIFL